MQLYNYIGNLCYLNSFAIKQLQKCSDKWIFQVIKAHVFIYKAPFKYFNRTYWKCSNKIVILDLSEMKAG